MKKLYIIYYLKILMIVLNNINYLINIKNIEGKDRLLNLIMKL